VRGLVIDPPDVTLLVKSRNLHGPGLFCRDVRVRILNGRTCLRSHLQSDLTKQSLRCDHLLIHDCGYSRLACCYEARSQAFRSSLLWCLSFAYTDDTSIAVIVIASCIHPVFLSEYMSLQLQSALVTGGTGFVGSAIIDALLEQHPECAITSLDIKPAHADAKRPLSVKYLTVDLTILEDALRVVQEVKPFVIIHTAGIVPPLPTRYIRRDRALVWKINVEGTRNMLAAARAAGAQAFVYTSSCCSVTDDMKYQYPNVDETWPTSNHSLIYGESKASS